MANTTSKKSQIVTDEDTDGFTRRVLMSLVVDVTNLKQDVERVHIQICTLARANGIEPPADE